MQTIKCLYIPYALIFIIMGAVEVAIGSLYDQNKIKHLLKPEHNFTKDLCFLECIKESLAGGVEGNEGEIVFHRGMCKHGCIIETRGIIKDNKFHIGTSYHVGPCLAVKPNLSMAPLIPM